MMPNIPDDILLKIQKLINLKEGAEAVNSLSEAENAAAKLQALLMKYNLDLDQVTAANIAGRAQIAIEEVWIDTEPLTKKSESYWVSKLYAAIARNNLCKVWWSHGKWQVNIIGHSHNIALVTYIADQMIEKVRIAEKSAWSIYHKENPHGEKKGTYRRGFLEGAAYGIMTRLDEEYIGMKDHSDNPYAVMIVGKEKEVDEWIWKKYPSMHPDNIKKAREEQRLYLASLTNEEREAIKKEKAKIKLSKGPKRNSSINGYLDGHEAGQRMEINKGVDSNKSKGQIN